MSEVEVFHNAKCGTSRAAIKILEDEGIEPKIFLYLHERLTARKLKAVLKKLKMTAREIVREKEPLFEENFLNQEYSEEEWIQILIKYPVLIERPIIIKGSRAILGRPLEKINTFFKWKKK